MSKTHEYVQYSDVRIGEIPVIEDVFGKCKQRNGKERQAYFMNIDGAAAESPVVADAPVQYIPHESKDNF